MERQGIRVRAATREELPTLLRLWGSLFDESPEAAQTPWRRNAHDWFDACAADGSSYLPVVEVEAQIVATAVGSLEIGVPNPYCPRGRVVRLANLVTAPEHRRQGYGAALVRSVVDWARSIDADRVDLSASEEAVGLYAAHGFQMTSAPRMKLVL
ncbi:GNAT family N-acetyltransferase [Dermacoccaceae bacterium W4C1]